MKTSSWWNPALFIRRDNAPMRYLWHYQMSTYAAIISIVLSVILIVWYWQRLPPAVPLWYSKPWGNDRLSHPLWLFLLPATTVVFYMLNVWISAQLDKDHQTFIKILSLASILTSIMNAIIVTKILSLVL